MRPVSGGSGTPTGSRRRRGGPCSSRSSDPVVELVRQRHDQVVERVAADHVLPHGAGGQAADDPVQADVVLLLDLQHVAGAEVPDHYTLGVRARLHRQRLSQRRIREPACDLERLKVRTRWQLARIKSHLAISAASWRRFFDRPTLKLFSPRTWSKSITRMVLDYGDLDDLVLVGTVDIATGRSSNRCPTSSTSGSSGWPTACVRRWRRSPPRSRTPTRPSWTNCRPASAARSSGPAWSGLTGRNCDGCCTAG